MTYAICDVRVLFTGSRTWTDPVLPVAALDRIQAQCCGMYRLVVVHGKCRTGLDKIVADWVDSYADPAWVIQDPYPASWGTGRRAGPIRNQEMVNSGPLLTIGFARVTPRDPSSGTLGCLRMSRKAGIPTVQVNWDDIGLPYFCLASRDPDGREPCFSLTEPPSNTKLITPGGKQ